MFNSRANSKLILAGEHSVVYGAPAISTPLAWATYCQLQPSPQGELRLQNELHAQTYQPQQLIHHWHTLTQRHQCWQQGQQISLMQQTRDLPLAVLAWWQQHYPLNPLSIHIHSEIPIGQGLGSSASLIVALLAALAHAHAQTLSQDDLQQAATELEQLAHGQSSGLDVATLIHNRLLYWQQGKATPLNPISIPGYLVFTGQAHSSTADCVAQVRQQHAHSQQRWHRMHALTDQLLYALQTHHLDQLGDAIEQLQQQLTQLGVVPKAVTDFATYAKQHYGWAGKICGAGSIQGSGAGFFWLLADREPQALCQQFNFPYWSLAQLTSISQVT